MSEFEINSEHPPYTVYRPDCSVYENPREWWRYIIFAELHKLRLMKRKSLWDTLLRVSDITENFEFDDKTGDQKVEKMRKKRRKRQKESIQMINTSGSLDISEGKQQKKKTTSKRNHGVKFNDFNTIVYFGEDERRHEQFTSDS